MQEEGWQEEMGQNRKHGLGKRKSCRGELQVGMIKLLLASSAPHCHQDIQKRYPSRIFSWREGHALNLNIAIWTRDGPAGEGGVLPWMPSYTPCAWVFWMVTWSPLDMSRLELDSERKEERLCWQGESSTERLGHPEGLLSFWDGDGTWQGQRPTTGAGFQAVLCLALKMNEITFNPQCVIYANKWLFQIHD